MSETLTLKYRKLEVRYFPTCKCFKPQSSDRFFQYTEVSMKFFTHLTCAIGRSVARSQLMLSELAPALTLIVSFEEFARRMHANRASHMLNLSERRNSYGSP